ncbi:hypothetical protein Cri9333_1243 [Crinalium epipsammum PCC 9333]|uniref:Uncharacterized protein n=1 Tax=Crinalium epipsammum PCC 9333 TaxID=1173022 RepID=K9VVL3_9CYAN|nr:hypothetical protein [Crinalium epipsammum]AFZ12143.1 hypothetical protein Cri9333_1243 [Crinalium epipsammum PCC 9333]
MNYSVNRSTESAESSVNQPQPDDQTVNLSNQSQPSTPDVTADTETASQTSAIANPETENPVDIKRQQPIPPPSEPMQYRAIGLVKGIYMPSADQFTQGTLLAADHTLIDAVLLGRIMSLVKNHLNLSENHLWVVYPRTRKEDDKLHVQIVGVWEPEHLSTNVPTTESGEEDPSGVKSTEVDDNYFSVRGEVIYQAKEEENIIVKIRQAARKESEEPKFFKLKLQGSFPDKMVGHFWDFQVQRQGDALVIQSGQDIGSLRPPKPRSSFKGKGKGRPGTGGKRPFSPPRVAGSSAIEKPVKRSEPLAKPIKKSRPQ